MKTESLGLALDSEGGEYFYTERCVLLWAGASFPFELPLEYGWVGG